MLQTVESLICSTEARLMNSNDYHFEIQVAKQQMDQRTALQRPGGRGRFYSKVIGTLVVFF